MKTNQIRRYDLDWLRVLVFGILIFYHVGMFFVPWGWHIKNNELSEMMRWPMLFVNQWRLSSLFLISGMGTCFALSFRSVGQYVSERMKRLLIPLIFGMLIIVPPQIYIERLVKAQFSGSYFDYFPFHAFVGIYPSGNLSWHHLWFLPYLLLFSLLLTPIFIRLRSNREQSILTIQRKWLSNPWFLYIYIFPLYLAEALLEPFFPVNNALFGDWFAIANYLTIFFLGFNFILLGNPFWKAVDKIRFKALALGILAFAVFVYIRLQEDSIMIHFTEAAVKVINSWSWILVLLGFSARWLNRPSGLLHYCNTAVYPFYILHQTITIIVAFFLYDKNLSIFWKFVLLAILTFLISLILYEGIRRITFLRPLFGLK